SQPKIEAATEGTAPQLSGRAEAYSTVTVYDGAKVLGTTTTGIDGTWTFQLPYGLSNGTHAVTVTATDPAGNTSMASAGYDVVVGPVAPPTTPVARAILDDLGRDSGSFNFDRLTNDGTAGRLLSGHVSAALAAGEKVQVSTDGGRTWLDALMKSDGTWVAIDRSAHAGSWTVQTRVSSSAGVAGPVNAYDVVLDVTSPGAPKSVSRSGSAIDVSLANTGVLDGDQVNVSIGDHRIMYTLTAADIAAGHAKVTIPAYIVATMNEHTSYGVALVDKSGNVSDYLVTRFEQSASGSVGASGANYRIVDFNDEKSRDLAAGTPIDFGFFTAVLAQPVKTGKGTPEQGIRTAGGSGFGDGYWGPVFPEVGETGLLLTLQRPATFYLKNGVHAQSLTLDFGLATNWTNIGFYSPYVRFYDDAGKEIFRFELRSRDTDIKNYEIILPDGMKFSSFSIGIFEGGAMTGGDADTNKALVSAWVDNVGFAGGDFGPMHSEVKVDFNSEDPKNLAGGVPIDFGYFTAILTSPVRTDKGTPEQGIRTAGGSGFGKGDWGAILPEIGETGLLVSLQKPPSFYLNQGAHARGLMLDFGMTGFNPSKDFYRPNVYFYNDDGEVIYKYNLGFHKAEIHHYEIVLPDGLEYSSFSVGMIYRDGRDWPMDFTQWSISGWIDNIGFLGGDFTSTSWKTITEWVPPADMQHIQDSSDASYFGSASGTEFQLDHVSYFSGSYAGVHGGAGVDVLKLNGANELLDVSKLIGVAGGNKLSSIEIIDITGSGNNTLKLSMSDVLELGHENLFRADGHTQMMVNGNAGDRVELSGMAGLDAGSWTNQGLATINGAAYQVYENAALNVELLVQSSVTTQLV
ncbi:Ig-like domain-containing protein, partial [Burkholderia ubonensis]|uniref:Ig-like domain-containing protein n=1 Tax=Burkholderia ubonensis TaxID=101571 RepID=UPI0012F719BD